MSNFTVEIFQVRDSSYNIGRKMGGFYRNKSIVHVYESIMKPEINVKNMESIFSTFALHLLDELHGLADGLQIPYRKAAALFSGYDIPKLDAMGCSAVVTPNYYVRNYDFSPDLYDGVFSLVQTEQSLASAGYNLQVLGRHDGVNEEGLVIGLHFVSNDGHREGIAAWTALRMVLDTCSSVDDAIQLLKEIPHAACYNFSIGDSKGDFAEVEASPDQVTVRRAQATLSCVNHFQDGKMISKNRHAIAGSVDRNNYLLSFENKQLTHTEMFDHFKQPDSPIFFTDYKNLFGTLHTFSYSFEDARILTVIAQGEQVLDIHFPDWVGGKDVVEKTLEGRIEE